LLRFSQGKAGKLWYSMNEKSAFRVLYVALVFSAATLALAALAVDTVVDTRELPPIYTALRWICSTVFLFSALGSGAI
jgi:hypothetical protein